MKRYFSWILCTFVVELWHQPGLGVSVHGGDSFPVVGILWGKFLKFHHRQFLLTFSSVWGNFGSFRGQCKVRPTVTIPFAQGLWTVFHGQFTVSVQSVYSYWRSPNGHWRSPNSHWSSPDGHSMVTEGQSLVTEGQSAVTEGHIMVTEGHIMVTEGHLAVTKGHLAVTKGQSIVSEGQSIFTTGQSMVTARSKGASDCGG